MDPQQQAAQAPEAAAQAADFVARFNEAILFPLITLLSGVAFLVFLYGCALYIFNASNDGARAEGKKHIMYGLIGLTVMISAYAILTMAVNSFGLGRQLDCASAPGTAGCAGAFTLPAAGS
jgi:Type IV secretion system pilin